MTERQLLNAARTGNTRAREQVIQRFYGLAVFHADRFFYPGADRDDVRQHALLGLLSGIDSWDPASDTPPAGFLTVCIKRMLATGLELHQRQKYRLLNEAVSLDDIRPRSLLPTFDGPVRLIDNVAGGADPADAVIARDELRIIAAKLELMTALEQRAARGFAAGESYAEIVGSSGRSRKAVDNAYTRARRKLAA